MFTLTSILRGVGDTMTPLLFMGMAVLMNAILDPFMIKGIFPFPKMGLNGAAWASIISQAFSLTLGFLYVRRKNSLISINIRKFTFDRHITWLIFKIGFPSMISGR
jgi:Na+-driven multidrug efflux pump